WYRRYLRTGRHGATIKPARGPGAPDLRATRRQESASGPSLETDNVQFYSRIAAFSALSKAESVNGFVKHSTAPCWRKRGRIAASCAVIKITGIFRPRAINSRYRSGPDMPGIEMSTIKHWFSST